MTVVVTHKGTDVAVKEEADLTRTELVFASAAMSRANTLFLEDEVELSMLLLVGVAYLMTDRSVDQIMDMTPVDVLSIIEMSLE